MKPKTRSLYDDAWYYDLILGKYAAGPVLEFYLRQIARFGQPVLELACGTGRFTVPLAQAGLNIIGLDISGHMLDMAERKAAERGIDVRFVQGDIRDFDLNQQFRFIFIPTQSLSHLHDREEIEKCFSCVKKHLADGGRFLIELFNPSLELLNREAKRRYFVGEYEDREGEQRITVTEEVEYNAATQINHIVWYCQREKDQEETALTFEMRQFFPREIDALLAYNGFSVDEKYGDYGEGVFSSTSPKQLIVCRAD